MRAAKCGDVVYLELDQNETAVLIAALAYYLARHTAPTAARLERILARHRRTLEGTL